MTEEVKTLTQLTKSNKLIRQTFRKMGPRSFKRGQGALLNALLEHDGETQRRLVDALGISRGELKDVAKKAARNGYVTIKDASEPRTYTIHLTEAGKAIAEKRMKANDKIAADVLGCLSDDERVQLNAICEKLIDSMQEVVPAA